MCSIMLYFHWICSAMAVNAAAIHACDKRLQLVPEWDLGELYSVLGTVHSWVQEYHVFTSCH